jgi:superfamily II DNA/RNA helicase
VTPRINQAIVFASTQIECDGLANDLQQDGFSAVALHGALSQGLRNRRLMALRQGQVQILVATDVAARGIDVPTITHVFNFGLPMKAEDYTHRIGRTGRAGRDGLAVTFAEFRDRRKIFDIEQLQPAALQGRPSSAPHKPPSVAVVAVVVMTTAAMVQAVAARGWSFGRSDKPGFDRGADRAPESRGFARPDRAPEGRSFDRAPERSFDRGQDRGFDRPARSSAPRLGRCGVGLHIGRGAQRQATRAAPVGAQRWWRT